METFKYFAYGSNMLTERLTDRCPTAEAIGIAVAVGYDLKFSKLSCDTSGKATLDKVAQPRRRTHGVVFKIRNCCLRALDKAEGKGKGYNRCDKFSITLLPDGKQTQVTTYIASACAVDDKLKPYDWYLALVIQGAIQHKLPKAYIASLREFASIPDPNQKRKTRKRAKCALARAGVQDYRKILKSPDLG